MMKRVRDIDLELAVNEDEDDDGIGDESSPNFRNHKYVSKKARWMFMEEDDSIARDVPVGRKSKGESLGPERERLVHLGITEIEVGLVELSTFGAQNLVVKGKAAQEEKLSAVGTHSVANYEEEIKQEQCEYGISKVQGQARHFLYPPAVLLQFGNDSEDNTFLHLLREQAALVRHSEGRVRLEAIRYIAARLNFIKSTATRGFIMEIIEQQLWKEEESSLIQMLLKLLSSASVIVCSDSSTQENSAPGFQVLETLLQYLSARSLRASSLSSSVKVQVLRSLYYVAGKIGFHQSGLFLPLVSQQLECTNSRLRVWAVRLLVQSVHEKRAHSSVTEAQTSRKGLDQPKKNMAGGELLLESLLEYTRDPHPSVREAAVNGIMKLHRKGYALKNSSYTHAVQLLRDSFESVRICAIKLVSFCAKEITQPLKDGSQSKTIDDAFLQVCNMMTDMSMKVRQVACHVLGGISGVSENILLQTLSKKAMALIDSKKEPVRVSPGLVSEVDMDFVKQPGVGLFNWSVAGAFVLGLEDEYWEVRSTAVMALAKLSTTCKKMAQGALDFLLDMLNDDSAYVRKQTMRSLWELALTGHLSIQETHLYMFLYVLDDPTTEMRRSAHALLSVILLPSIATYQILIRGLLASLEKHPEDEGSLMLTLERTGRIHSNQTECIANELLQELRGLFTGETGFDDVRCAGILVLLLAAALSNSRIIALIPAQIALQASVFCQKLPRGLPVLSIQPLGFQTSEYSWSKMSAVRYFVDVDIANPSIIKKPELIGLKEFGVSEELPSNGSHERDADSWHDSRFGSEIIRSNLESSQPRGQFHPDSGAVGFSKSCTENPSAFYEDQRNLLSKSGLKETVMVIGHILANAHSASSYFKLNSFSKALKILSGCRRELRAIGENRSGIQALVTFSGLYLQCLTLLAHFQSYLFSQDKNALAKSASPYDLLHKLEVVVKRLLHCFLGFTIEQLWLLYELRVLVSVWRLALPPVKYSGMDVPLSAQLSELASSLRVVDKILKFESTLRSELFTGAKQQLLETEVNSNSLSVWRAARQLAGCYWPSQSMHQVSLREIWAAIDVPGVDFEHPLAMLPGLPVGIPIHVTLHNVSHGTSVWVQLKHKNLKVQFSFIDIAELGTIVEDDVIHLKTVIQLHEVPPVAASVVKVCIVLEGAETEEAHTRIEGCRGPKGFVVPLCGEKEIHLATSRDTIFCRSHLK